MPELDPWIVAPVAAGLLAVVAAALLTFRGLPLFVARRYLSHFKLTIVSTITLFAMCGTTLAVAALTTVTGISTGFQAEFQRKVLGVNAHVLVLKYLDFTEYREVMESVLQVPGVVGVNPFVINEMMVVHGTSIAGVLLKGVDPELMPTVLDLPRHLIDGSLDGLRLAGAEPPAARQPRWGRSWPDPVELDGLVERPGREDGATPEGADGSAPENRDVGVPGVVPRARPEGGATAQDLDDAVAAALEVELAPESESEDEVEQQALPGIVLGKTLAREIDARVGDTVRVITPLSGLDVSLWAPEAQTPRSRELRVVGIFYSGFDEYDTRLVYVDLFEAQAFYDHGDVVTGVEIRLDDPNDAHRVATQLEETLGGSPYRVLDWEELNHNLFTALRIQKLALTVVVSLLVVVSGLLIIATLVMMIFEKKREIAILKAMGATNGAVMRIYLLVGSSIGAIGTSLGVGLGYLVCRLLIAYGWPLDPGVYLIDHLPVEIDPIDYAVVSTVAFGICILATVLPSWLTAATMKPVEGLRHE